MCTLSTKEVFEAAYKITMIEEIMRIFIFESECLSNGDLQALTQLDGILERIYAKWLKCIANVREDLKETIDELIEELKVTA
jgi:hypothetical protein